MKAYKIWWQDTMCGCQVRWRSNYRDAKIRLNRARKEHRKTYKMDAEPNGIEPVEIPTNKFELIDWLNIHMTEDNG